VAAFWFTEVVRLGGRAGIAGDVVEDAAVVAAAGVVIGFVDVVGIAAGVEVVDGAATFSGTS